MSATRRAVIGHARLILLVRAAVGVVRHDRGDAAGAGALERVDHDQQLHDRLLDRSIRRLDQEHVAIAGVVLDLDEDVLVGELEHLDIAELTAKVARDLAREVRIGVARIQVELVARIRVHGTAAESGHETYGPPDGPPLSGMSVAICHWVRLRDSRPGRRRFRQLRRLH